MVSFLSSVGKKRKCYDVGDIKRWDRLSEGANEMALSLRNGKRWEAMKEYMIDEKLLMVKKCRQTIAIWTYYTVVKVDGSTPKFGGLVRGHDKAQNMGVASHRSFPGGVSLPKPNDSSILIKDPKYPNIIALFNRICRQKKTNLQIKIRSNRIYVEDTSWTGIWCRTNAQGNICCSTSEFLKGSWSHDISPHLCWRNEFWNYVDLNFN